MANTISYEVYAFKGGGWVVDSVYDDRQQALHEARLLLGSRHLTGVQVIEEKFDDESGDTMTKIIFTERKGAANGNKPKPRPKAPASRGVSTTASKKEKPEKEKKGNDTVSYIIKLVLITGGGALALIALLFGLINYLG